MKKLLKLSLALCGVFMLVSATSANAQKFGYIDVQEVLMKMPGLKDVEEKLQRFTKERQDQLEIMQVEYNRKVEEYQKGIATFSDAVKKDKETELGTLQQRIQSFGVDAQEEISAEENKLLTPLLERIEAALTKVSKANNIVGVFPVGVFVYFDEAAMTNMVPLVATELGIK